MSNSGIIRSLGLLAFGSVVAALGGCSEDVLPQASGGLQAAPAEMSADEGRENHAPEISAIRFDPAEPIPGERIRADVGVADIERDPIELGYTWKVNGRRAVSEGPAFEIPANLRKGDRIEVSVIASDGKANSQPVVQSVRIENQAPSIQGIEIRVRGDEDGKLGQWVADPLAQDPDEDDISFRYSWIVNGRTIDDGQTGELDRSKFKRGDKIQLVVTATDGEAESAPLESAPFTIENSPPDIESRPPAMDPSGQFTYVVRASDRDGDRGLRYSLNKGPAGMAIDAFSGELRWRATVESAGEHVVEVAVDDRHGGVTKQTFYVQVSAPPASAR